MANVFELGMAGKGARTKLRTAGDWCVKIRLDAYDWKRVRPCSDKETSATWARLLQAAVDRQNAGEPPNADTLKRLPRRLLESFGLVSTVARKRAASYAENVGDYIGELKTAGRDAKYVRNADKCLTKIGTACGFKKLRDIDRASFVSHLVRRSDDGTAPRTLNNIIATVKGFCGWCVETKRIDTNPVQSVKRVDQSGDRRRNRRALMPMEVERLLLVAGPRELVYRVALGTGLRRRELQRLQWRDVAIDGGMRPCLKLRAEATKSKRADVLPLSPQLAERLKTARPADAAPTDSVFRSVPTFDTWVADLKRAGIEYRSDDGRIAGFHSLRVTFVSELERAGVSPRTIMELARHRDYRLTAGTYTDVRVLDTFGAAARLPQYDDKPETTSEAAKRTGTYDAPVSGQDQIQDQMGCSKVQSGATGGATGENRDPAGASENAVLRLSGGVRKTPRVGLEPTT